MNIFLSSKKVILQPRKVTYKTKQKSRRITRYKKSTLSYGFNGLRLLQPLNLTSKQIFRLNILLKHATKKSDKTKRSYWFNIFPHLPLTRKIKGSRMGKGVGKLKLWFTFVPAGSIMLEFKHLRKGRAFHYTSQIQTKLNIQSVVVLYKTKEVKLGFARRTNLSLTPLSF